MVMLCRLLKDENEAAAEDGDWPDRLDTVCVCVCLLRERRQWRQSPAEEERSSADECFAVRAPPAHTLLSPAPISRVV